MTHKTKKKLIGIQNLFNQMWFRAKCGDKSTILLRRKRWGHFTNNSDPNTKWTYATVYDATKFKSADDAHIVCDRLKAKMPDAEWAVVEYKETIQISFKPLYKPKKCCK